MTNKQADRTVRIIVPAVQQNRFAVKPKIGRRRKAIAPGYNPQRVVLACAMYGITAQDIALAIGVSASVLSIWKSGLSGPDADEVGRMEEFFGVSAGFFSRGVVRIADIDECVDGVV